MHKSERITMKSYFKTALIAFLIILCGLFISVSCSKKGEENKYSMSNIIVATWHIIKTKGVTSVSGEEINAEIEKKFNSIDDVLQKKSTIRQRESDNSNDYKVIFEDSIAKEKEKKERLSKDPLKK
jgi:hypothetical protein